jgi:hypothetical protein
MASSSTLLTVAVGSVAALGAIFFRHHQQQQQQQQQPPSDEPLSADSSSGDCSTCWLGISAGLGAAVVVGVVVWRLRVKRRVAAAQLLRPAPQEPKLELKAKPLPPGKGSPVFHGIRVLEFATHIAGPTVGRVFAELGAEVIKVEQPSGDIFRRTLVDFEKPRVFGTAFENSNVGKYSIVLDLKTEQGILAFKKLVAEADILVTNVRQDSLVALGLDSDAIRAEFPHVVYGQVSAWGPTGRAGCWIRSRRILHWYRYESIHVSLVCFKRVEAKQFELSEISCAFLLFVCVCVCVC